jgi:hypothetical protein
MAWNNVGPVVTLEPGATVSWQYWFDGNADQGVQIAGPHTGSFASPGALGTAIAFDQGKIVEGINQVIYVVSIKNIATSSRVRHNLEGGGVT